MVETFTKYTNEALDEVAPYKTFKIKSQYKFGLSEDTKIKRVDAFTWEHKCLSNFVEP